MVRTSGGDRSSVTPDDRQPQTLPRESLNNSDFMLAAMMDLKASFARVEQKLETLEKCVDKHELGVHKLEHTLSQVKGGLVVGGIFFTIALAIIGWMVAGDVKLSTGGGTPPSATAPPSQNSATPASEPAKQ